MTTPSALRIVTFVETQPVGEPDWMMLALMSPAMPVGVMVIEPAPPLPDPDPLPQT